jgi:hypothetical protein
MPVRHKLAGPQLPQEEQLRQQLEDEMRQPYEEGEPLVVIEQTQPNTMHLWVVWSSFDGVDQVVRWLRSPWWVASAANSLSRGGERDGAAPRRPGREPCSVCRQ